MSRARAGTTIAVLTAVIAAVLATVFIPACGDAGSRPQAPRAGTASAAGAAAKSDWRVVDRDVTSPIPIEWLGARGTGAPYADGDVAVVHWIGRRRDGARYMGTVPDAMSGTAKPLDPLPNEYDARNAAPRPFAFEVGRGHVIPGMDRVVKEMRVGDHAKAKIRAALAYGDLGFGNQIPQASDITLEIWAVGRIPPLAAEVVAKGDGPKPGPLDLVWMHVVVSNPQNGEVLQSSRLARPEWPEGRPLGFQRGAGTVIEGIELLMRTMRVGDRVKARVPWFYAYGAEPRSYGDARMPAMTDLDYDLEMVAVGPDEPGKR